MKTLIFKSVFYLSLFLITITQAYSQSTLRVQAGKTKVITPKEQNLIVEHWIMEDNSTIIIDPSLSIWKFTANKATIGKNCKIIARGKNGKSGTNGTQGKSHANCTNAGHGINGGNGGNGSNGINLDLNFNIVSLGSIEINSSGGNGGIGGNGGNGGNGGRARCGKNCNGGNGGNGGGKSGRGRRNNRGSAQFASAD